MFLKKKINSKRLIIFISIFILLFLLATIFFKSLKTENLYIPNKLLGKKISNFSSKSLLDDQYLDSEKIFINKKYYLINIWASWCGPCRDEHPYLVKLSQNNKLKIVGINYKDNPEKALLWLKKLGNPYSEVVEDNKGKIAIDWGVYGIPETFIVNSKGIIKYRHIGPVTKEIYKKINLLIEEIE